MKSFLVCLSSVALSVGISSTALANVQFENLYCTALAKNGKKVSEIVYRIEVVHGFDTRLTGPNGEHGQKFEIFNLYTKNSAKARNEAKAKLTLDGGNRAKAFLSTDSIKVIADKDYAQATIQNLELKAEALCTNPKKNRN